MKNNLLRNTFAIAALAGACLASPAFAGTVPQEAWGGDMPQAQGPGLSRAEVLADLVLWRRAGLDAFGTGEAATVSNPAYAHSLAEYQRLRSGPEYLAQVRQFGGGASTVASQPGTQQTH